MDPCDAKSHDGDDDDDSQEGLISSRIKRKRARVPIAAVAVILVQFVVILLLGASLVIFAGEYRPYSFFSTFCPSSKTFDLGINSPASKKVRLQEKTLYAHHPSNGPYLGRPSPEINAAWAKLTRPSYIWVTKEELDAANVTAMEAPNNDYLVTLNVYHHLHCLRAIKRYIYAEYYHPGVPVEQIRTEAYSDHIDHCVDLVRETVMCQPDFSIAPFQLVGDGPGVPVTSGETTHQCVDWEYFETWPQARALDIKEVLDYWTSISGKTFEDP